MQDSHQSVSQTPSTSWSYSRSTFPSLSYPDHDLSLYQAQAFKHFGDNEEEVLAVANHRSVPGATAQSGVYQLWQSAVADSSPTENAEMEMRTKLADLVVALRASERARNEGENETDALRRYLAEVEVAAAGLVSRIQELEHILTLSTANQEKWDVEQLRGQMLALTARDARQQAVAASEAISAARQATMDLDKVKREASALTSSQEEEIMRLNAEVSHYRILFEGKEAQLQQMKRVEEKLIHQHGQAEEALNACNVQISSLRQGIDGMKKGEEEKAEQVHDLIQALEFAKATACAAECKLQEAQVEKKDMSVQNELLQHEVADLQSREVQATIAHYDHELCKVRAVLEGEKAQLLTELARYRRGNQNLKGELAECRGKYNAMRSQSMGALEFASTAYEPTAYSSSKLREFFTLEHSDAPAPRPELYLLSDHAESTMVPVTPSTSQPTQAESRERQLAYQSEHEEQDVNHQEKPMLQRLDSESGQLAVSQRSHSDQHLGVPEGKENEIREKYFMERRDMPNYPTARRLSDSEVFKLDRIEKNETYLKKKKKKSLSKSLGNQEIALFSDMRPPDADGIQAMKMDSVASHGQGPFVQAPGIAFTEDNCLDTGENLLAEAHREICKLKQEKRGDNGKLPFAASLKLFGPIIFFLLRVVTRQGLPRRAGSDWEVTERHRINDTLHQGLKFLEMRLT